MTRWLHGLCLLGSIATSAGVNHVLTPKVDYALGVGERTLSTGSFTFEQDGSAHRFQLVNAHVVTADVPRPFGDPIVVRTLRLCSPEVDGQASPDVELLFDLAAGAARPIDPTVPDARAFRSRALPVIVRAIGADLTSHVRAPGASEPSQIASGELVITEALELDKGNPTEGWRIHGELSLVTVDGERRRPATGTIDARLIW